MAVSESGIETGVIKGIREDSEEIDFGRCGVKLAETAVRMSGQVISNSYNANAAASAEWKQIDNIIKLTPVDLENECAKAILKGIGFGREYRGQELLSTLLEETTCKYQRWMRSSRSVPVSTETLKLSGILFPTTDGEASMVVVSLEKIDDGQDLTVSGVASGEIYMHNGKYMTVDESDIITDFSEY
ncbi:hypothetical protein MHU86_16600 [Fragilaria crotonensis]|nr:hypothetical protein MHU86_16600 [Fragilaria crotonensis]